MKKDYRRIKRMGESQREASGAEPHLAATRGEAMAGQKDWHAEKRYRCRCRGYSRHSLVHRTSLLLTQSGHDYCSAYVRQRPKQTLVLWRDVRVSLREKTSFISIERQRPRGPLH